MDNQIVSGILAQYARQREENRREEDRRLREIEEKLPGVYQLVAQRHQMILSSVRSAFAAASEDPEARMRAFNRQIADGLRGGGYPEDYLAPVCRCALCGDTGFVYENALQTPCRCLLDAYRKAVTGSVSQAEQTFAGFDESRFPDDPLPGTDVTQREYMIAVKQRCLLFAQNVPAGPIKTLLLHGGSGLGKTFLLNCVGNDALSRGVETLSVTAYDLLMDLKNAYFSRSADAAQGYFDVPLLLIDDLGMEPLMENVTVEQIYNLLNARLTKGLFTAVSTNLSRAELKQRYTERLSSRLLDPRTGLAIPFQGRDIRLIREEKP